MSTLAENVDYADVFLLYVDRIRHTPSFINDAVLSLNLVLSFDALSVVREVLGHIWHSAFSSPLLPIVLSNFYRDMVTSSNYSCLILC